MSSPVIPDLGNISKAMQAAAGQSALALQDIVSYPVDLAFSEMELISEANKEICIPFLTSQSTVVKLHFDGGLEGAGFLILSEGQDQRLAEALFTQDAALQETENAVEMVLCEIGNVLLNVYIGTLANYAHTHVRYHVPQLFLRKENTVWAEELFASHIPPHQILILKNALIIGEISISTHVVIVMKYSEYDKKSL